MRHLSARQFEFGPFCIDTGNRQLRREGEVVPLTPKAFELLLALVENRGQVLEKDELLARVWPDSIVEEANLTVNISTLRKALGESRHENRYITTVAGRGYKFVAEVRELDAADGSPLADAELIVAEQTVASITVEEESRSFGRPLVIGLAAVLAVLIAGYLFHTARKPSAWAQPAAGLINAAIPAPRRSVAVLGFKNLSGRADAAWLSTAFAEMLSTELATGQQLRTIPGENIARMKIELALPEADSLASDTLGRVGKNLGVELVILGSYLTLGREGGGKIRLDLRLQNTATGETMAAVAENGTEASLFDLIWRAGARLREQLGVKALPEAETSGLRASLPANWEAARLYAEGLQKLRRFEAVAARDLLEKAVAADPNYPLAHSALAAAHLALGYDVKAQEEAKRAFDLSAKLSREEQLSVEARYRETAKEWDKAIELYRALAGFFPDNLDYGLRLVAAQSAAGGKDALATIDALRQRVPADDARIDLAEALAAEPIRDFNREAAAAAKAAAKGAAQEARLLVARARLAEAWAQHHLGQPARAIALGEEARAVYAAVNDRNGVAETLHTLALVLYEKGAAAEGRKRREESLAIYREIGNRRGVARSLNGLANILHEQGDWVGARAAREEALAIFREVGNKNGAAVVLNNLGNLALDQSRYDEAAPRYEEALALFRELGNQNGAASALNGLGSVRNGQGAPAAAKKLFEESLAIKRASNDQNGVATALYNISTILFDQGDLAGARRASEESLTICRHSEFKHLAAFGLAGLGDIAAVAGDFAVARQRHEEALALRRELGEQLLAASSRLELAQLALEEGRAAETETTARAVAAQYRREKAAYDEARAGYVLARALLAQGKVAEAQQAIARAASLARQAGDHGLNFSIAITSARVLAATGKSAEALQSLNATLAAAQQTGHVRFQFEARLALGEIEMKSGQQAAARVRLAALEADAAAKGFSLLARQAAAVKQQN